MVVDLAIWKFKRVYQKLDSLPTAYLSKGPPQPEVIDQSSETPTHSWGTLTPPSGGD